MTLRADQQLLNMLKVYPRYTLMDLDYLGPIRQDSEPNDDPLGIGPETPNRYEVHELLHNCVHDEWWNCQGKECYRCRHVTRELILIYCRNSRLLEEVIWDRTGETPMQIARRNNLRHPYEILLVLQKWATADLQS